MEVAKRGFNLISLKQTTLKQITLKQGIQKMGLVIRESIGYMVDQLRGESGFTREQAEVIVNHLWDASEDDGTDWDFCPVEIRGEWYAYNIEDIRSEFCNIDAINEAEDSDDIIEALGDRTIIAGYTDEWAVFRVF